LKPECSAAAVYQTLIDETLDFALTHLLIGDGDAMLKHSNLKLFGSIDRVPSAAGWISSVS